jgi:shikimate kinase
MPGCGKSTVGRQLARNLQLRFLDVDHEVERRVGMSVRELFEASGELAFRDLEAEVLADILDGEPAVVSTGGGTVLREGNRALLHRLSTVIYLRSTPEESFRRLRHDTQRPLLQVPDPLRKLRELYAQRDPLYRQAAHYVIETGRPSVPTLINMILMQLELAGMLDASRVPSSVEPRPRHH